MPGATPTILYPFERGHSGLSKEPPAAFQLRPNKKLWAHTYRVSATSRAQFGKICHNLGGKFEAIFTKWAAYVCSVHLTQRKVRSVRPKGKWGVSESLSNFFRVALKIFLFSPGAKNFRSGGEKSKGIL